MREEEEQGGRGRVDYERRSAREARLDWQEKEERRRGSRREEEDQVRSRRQEGGSYRSMNEFPPLRSARPGNGRWGAGPAPRARA